MSDATMSDGPEVGFAIERLDRYDYMHILKPADAYALAPSPAPIAAFGADDHECVPLLCSLLILMLDHHPLAAAPPPTLLLFASAACRISSSKAQA